MACRLTPAWICAALLLGAAGCATTVREPPPEVASQPPAVTTDEAVAEEQRSAAQADAASDTGGEDPSAVRARRIAPTTRSTQEIRDQNADSPRALDFGQRLDRAHDRVYAWGQQLVETTDRGLAARDRTLQPVPAAPFRLGTSLEILDRADGLQPAANVNFDITLRLPNIEKRLRVFITSAELDSGMRDSRQHSQLRAGLRYELLKNLDFDAGIRVDLPPVAFTAVQWSRELPLGSWDFYPLVKLFAETKESVGYATGATFDRWSGRQLLRSASYAKWRHDHDRTEWSQTFVYARASQLLVPDRYGSYISADDIGRGWGLRLLASGENTDRVARYEGSVFYRGQASNHWLYWFVEPLVRWDREWNWSADPGIRIGIDVLFWDLARPARRVSRP